MELSQKDEFFFMNLMEKISSSCDKTTHAKEGKIDPHTVDSRLQSIYA